MRNFKKGGRMKMNGWLALASVTLWGALGNSPAMALPVLNGNIPSNQMVTIYPDNQDKNVFYLVPRRLKMASDPQGQPEFLYTDVSRSLFTTGGVIQVSMVPDFSEKELEAAKANILAFNPQAKFAVVPFISSKLIFDNRLLGLVESSDCNHHGGVVGSEQACVIGLSSQGRRVLLDSLKKRGTIYIHFQYEVAGVREDAKKGYEAAIGTWDISGAIGGAGLSAHPELFLDTHGLPIEFDSIGDKRPVLNEAFQLDHVKRNIFPDQATGASS
jgi:hypothetical protein